jgi:L-alanine-DL-glutamate epimerase-like enolase superfamily enzyme
MKISDLEFFLVEPRRRGGELSHRSLLVRLATASGEEGWGEARSAWRPTELSARRDALLPGLAGRSVFDVEELLELDALAFAPLRCAVEMACWDLVGRAARQPLCHLFGGEYRARIPLAVRLPRRGEQRTSQMARELAEQGFHTQIVTCGGNAAEDLKTLDAVRTAIGDRAKLRLDGAAGYPRDDARELCAELEKKGLQFFLDPVVSANPSEVAALARLTSLPLAVSRGVNSASDVLALARGGSAPHVVIELDRVGGILPARCCAAVADAGGVRVSLGGGCGLGPALAARLQLAAATRNLESSHECAYYRLHEDVLTERLPIGDGMIHVPQGPGLGIEIDRAKLEACQVT